jgi:hypothetical protein
MVVLYCVECKHSFFSCNMFTLIGYSFVGKIRRYFLLQVLVSAAIACFLFLMLQYIGMTSMLYWKLWFVNRPQHFSHLLIFLQTQVLYLWTLSKNAYSFRHLDDFLPPTIHFYLGILVLIHHTQTTQQHITYWNKNIISTTSAALPSNNERCQ